MTREESIRIHLDWWEKCRTCAFFMGDRETCHLARAMCSGVGSPFHGEIVTDEGYCSKWDSFDPEVAFGLLELWNEGIDTTHASLPSLADII